MTADGSVYLLPLTVCTHLYEPGIRGFLLIGICMVPITCQRLRPIKPLLARQIGIVRQQRLCQTIDRRSTWPGLKGQRTMQVQSTWRAVNGVTQRDILITEYNHMCKRRRCLWFVLTHALAEQRSSTPKRQRAEHHDSIPGARQLLMFHSHLLRSLKTQHSHFFVLSQRTCCAKVRPFFVHSA